MKVEILSRIFNNDNYTKLVNFIERGFKNISFDDNFGNEVVNAIIPATTEIKIPHGLKTTPKYKVILRHIGNGLVTDGDGKWTDKYITIRNQGAVEVRVTISIHRS